MKVVLFCGGLGTRLREHSETIPKPLVPIGARPIIWHLMKYYAHHGHREFVLCLGYGGDHIRQFFLNYDARGSEDFVLMGGKSKLVRTETDVPDWKIHFIDTGLKANIGERLTAVRHLVEDEELFLANYSDQLSDLPLPAYLDWFAKQNAVASFLAVKPSQSFHLVQMDGLGKVARLQSVAETDTWINGGYLVLKPQVFDFIRAGEELVERPFARLVEQNLLVAHRYEGFWKAMDTIKDKLSYDEMDARGERPWMVWR
jgi:glucose-1-phosphate cytidylyltransferase